MSNYQYILLDWDGNLAQTLHIWFEACKIPLEKRGLELSDTEIAASFGAFTKYIAMWGLVDETDQIMNEADAIAKKKLPNVELYPDTLEVLEGLKKAGKTLALITTSQHENVAHLLEKYNLLQYFETIVAYEDTEKHKPDPQPIDEALKRLKGTKAKAVMIGDSDKDMGAAQNANVDSILFYPDEHKKYYDLNILKKHNPTHIVEDFRKILTIV